MERRLEHRAVRISLVNGLSTVLMLLFQLISVPICLKYWGKQTYGSWLALLSAFMLIRSLDGGFTAYVGNKLNYLYHQSHDELRRHLGSAVTGIVLIAALQLLIVTGVLIFEPLASALGMPTAQVDRASAQGGLVIMIIAGLLTGSYIGIVHRLMIPAGLMYQAAWWSMGFQTTQFLAVILASVSHFNLQQTGLLFAGVQVVIYVASAVYLRYKLPEFYPWVRGLDIRMGLRDLAHSTMLTASNIIQQGAVNGAVLMVAALAGPAAVPTFTTVRTATNLWTSVTSVLTAPLLPEVVRLHVHGEVRKLVAINQTYWVVVGSAVNLGALLCYPAIPYLYGLWTAHLVTLNGPLLSMMLGSVIVANAGALMSLHLNGINSLRITLAASVIRACVALGGGALFYARFGILGFGLGILAGEILATLVIGRHYLRHEFAGKGLWVPLSVFGPICLSTGISLLFFVAAGLGAVRSLWEWAATLALVTTVALWGWGMLQHELKDRLTSLAMSWVPRRLGS